MSGGQRVFLVDGQAVYLEGDGDITEDVLQQALAQLAAGGAQTVEEAEMEPEPEPEPEPEEQEQEGQDVDGVVLNTEDMGEEEEGVLAILQDETGQQQTVRLTPDQAAALGIDYEQLLAAAAGGEEPDSVEVEEEKPVVAAEHNSAQEVASLATSVVLDLNESQPSLVNQSDGGDKVTYTFEVMDKDVPAGPGQQPRQLGGDSGLLAKSRDIMVPRVRSHGAGYARQIQQQIHRTAAQVLRTSTPSAPVPRDPITGGYASPATLKKGPVYNTGPNSLQNKQRRTVINTADTVQQPAQTASMRAPSMPSFSGGGGGGDHVPSSIDMDDDVDDLPVILTPVGNEQLPDFIEPRPGMKILVRPLEAAAGGASASAATMAGRSVGSSDNPIQLVQQGNTFKSLQPLTNEQLKQIATVLQQSRLNVPSNSKNSLYDADTNTRIVYRVVYPEEVGRGGGGGGGGRGRGRGVRGGRARGRGYVRASRPADDGDADWSPELSRNEGKRAATKTRTGRVSKPPKHMVKDYRRINRLDMDEADLDDSDGGYKEWEEGGGGDTIPDSIDLSNDAPFAGDTAAPSVAAAARLLPEPPLEELPRPKRQMAQALRDRFTCRTCHALCIGYMRLEAHFAKYPDHVRPVYVPPKTPAVVRKPYGRPGAYRPGFGRGRGRGRGRGPRGTYLVPASYSAAKRPRLDPDPYSDPLVPAELLLSHLVAQSGGSVDRLCDGMSAVLDEFRYHVRTAVTPAPAAQRLVAPSAARRSADGPVLKIDEERSSLTGLPSGTYVLWPTVPAADDPGESMSGDVGEAASVSPAPADASPTAATTLCEAVMEAVSEGGSLSPVSGTDQSAFPTPSEQESTTPAAATETAESPPAEEVAPPPAAEPLPEPAPLPPVEKEVLSAAEISQMALAATEGTHMPMIELAPPLQYPAAEGGGPQATNGGVSASEAAHRAVSDVLDEFVDGLVDAPDYSFAGETVADLESAQLQLRMAKENAATVAGPGMPMLEDGR